MSEYTKGPWKVRKTGPHWNNPDLIDIEINYGDDEECICDTVYRIEDANLIAAAPDMLEALEQAVTSMLDSGYSTKHLSVKAGIEAIAKAKGESNE